jgi:hypothetical protein
MSRMRARSSPDPNSFGRYSGRHDRDGGLTTAERPTRRAPASRRSSRKIDRRRNCRDQRVLSAVNGAVVDWCNATEGRASCGEFASGEIVCPRSRDHGCCRFEARSGATPDAARSVASDETRQRGRLRRFPYGTASEAADFLLAPLPLNLRPTATRRGRPREREGIQAGDIEGRSRHRAPRAPPRRAAGCADAGVDKLYVQQIGARKEDCFAA